MFHVHTYTLKAENTENNPKIVDMKLSQGIIHQVDILFQDGCNGVNKVQIYQGGSQIWPSNRQGAFSGNATVVSFREFFPVKKGANEFTAKLWTEDTATLGTVVIQIGVLPRGILQPLSFNEIVKAIKGV